MSDPRAATPSSSAASTSACRRPPLSCERIVDAAISYIDRRSIAELSMRKLGAGLGVEAMSLYRYFPNKAALLDGVVSALLADIVQPRGDEPDPAAAVLAWARSVRRVAHQHPRVFPLLLTLGHEDARVVRFAEGMMRLWTRAGLERDVAALAHDAVVGYTMGSTIFEIGGDRATPGGRDAGAERAHLAAHDAGFEFGLGLLLDGLRPGH